MPTYEVFVCLNSGLDLIAETEEDARAAVCRSLAAGEFEVQVECVSDCDEEDDDDWGTDELEEEDEDDDDDEDDMDERAE